MEGVIRELSPRRGCGVIEAYGGELYTFQMDEVLGAEWPARGDAVSFQLEQAVDGAPATVRRIRDLGRLGLPCSPDALYCMNCGERFDPSEAYSDCGGRHSSCRFCGWTGEDFEPEPAAAEAGRFATLLKWFVCTGAVLAAQAGAGRAFGLFS